MITFENMSYVVNASIFPILTTNFIRVKNFTLAYSEQKY